MTVAIDLDGFAMGADTAYEVRPEGVEGLLGNPAARTADVERGHADGAVFASDYLASRVVTIPITVLGSSPSDCLSKIEDLRDAWLPIDDPDTMATLTITLWGVEYTLTGRPRGCEVVAPHLKSGVAEALCQFDCPDPTLVTGS